MSLFCLDFPEFLGIEIQELAGFFGRPQDYFSMEGDLMRDSSCVIGGEDGEDSTMARLTTKGIEGIENAAKSRGKSLSLTITPGMRVHRRCRERYTNKKDIECSLNLPKVESVRKTRKFGSYNNQNDCLFCCQLVKERDIGQAASRVKTDVFVIQILECCKSRGDDWAAEVQGRVNFYNADLHAADVLYHHTCDSYFRKGQVKPVNGDPSEPAQKRRRSGRPP